MQTDGWKSIQLRLMFIYSKICLFWPKEQIHKRGSERYKGQPSNPRANQYRICSVSCSLQKMLINYRPTTLFTYFFILAIYGFGEKLNNLEIISVRLWRMGGAGRADSLESTKQNLPRCDCCCYITSRVGTSLNLAPLIYT